MTSIADYIGGLRAFLAADGVVSALAADVIAPEVRNTDVATMPKKLVVLKQSGGPSLIDRGYLYVREHRVDVTCYGETPYEADRLHRAVFGALVQMRRVVQEGAMLHWAMPESTGLQMRDPDTEWPMVVSSWQVFASEMEVA